ncbi:MAG: macro domain-containing protein [Gemmatimonadota bacterium]
MIDVVIGDLASQSREGVVRAIRTDLTSVDAGARDVILAAGRTVGERLQKMGSLPVGGACITPGGDLSVPFIIHVVTSSDEEPESALSVERALRNGLRRASEWGLTSLSIPALGMGAGHLDVEGAARTQVEVLVDHLDAGHPPLELTLVVRGPYEADLYERLVGEMTRGRFPMRN